MKKFIQPFRMGDVVLIEKEEHIIQNISLDTDGKNFHFSYSTHRSAWHDHEDCFLVRECDEAAMKKLVAAIEEERRYEYD